MDLDDLFFIISWGGSTLGVIVFFIRKFILIGKVQIMKIGDAYSVRQFATGKAVLDGRTIISFDNPVDSRWTWIDNGGMRTYPKLMTRNEAEQLANEAFNRYLAHLEKKKRDKEARKAERIEEKKKRPVIVKTIKRKSK